MSGTDPQNGRRHDGAPRRHDAEAVTHEHLSPQSTLHRRHYAAPATLVQEAYTDPSLFVRWMGPEGATVDLERFEPVTGGSFRYVVRAGTNGAWAFRGSYHLVEPGRIVHTWEFEGDPAPSLEILTFTDEPNGGSLHEVLSTQSSLGASDHLEANNMADEAMAANLDRIAALLEDLGA